MIAPHVMVVFAGVVMAGARLGSARGRPELAGLRLRWLATIVVLTAIGAVIGGIGGTAVIVAGTVGEAFVTVAVQRSLAAAIRHGDARRIRALQRIGHGLSWPYRSAQSELVAQMVTLRLEGRPDDASALLAAGAAAEGAPMQVQILAAVDRQDVAATEQLARSALHARPAMEPGMVALASLSRTQPAEALGWITVNAAVFDRWPLGVSHVRVLANCGAVEEVDSLASHLGMGPYGQLDHALAVMRSGSSADDLLRTLASDANADVASRAALLQRERPAPVALDDAARSALSAVVERIGMKMRAMPSPLAVRRRPIVLYVLALGCLAAYLLELRTGDPASTDVLRRVGGYTVIGGHLVGGEWRLVSAPFLHVGPAHLFFNLVGLLVVGRLVEQRTGGLVVLMTWFVGSAASLIVEAMVVPNSVGTVIVGASGAVMALLGVALSQAFTLWRIDRSTFARRGVVLLGIIAGAQILSDPFTPGVAGAGHVAGLLTGVLIGILTTPRSSIARLRAT